MRNGIVGSLTALVAGSGIALGQGYYPAYPAPAYYPPPASPSWQMPRQQMPMQPMSPQQMQHMAMQQQMHMQQMQHMHMQQMQMQQAPQYAMPMPAAPMMAAPGGPMMAPPFNQGGQPVYAQPYYPAVRTYGTVDGQQYPGVSAPVPAAAAQLTPMPVQPSAPPAEVIVSPAPEQITEPHTVVVPEEEVIGDYAGHAPGTEGPADKPAPRGYSSYSKVEALYWWLPAQTGPVLLNVAGVRGITTVSTQDLINRERLGGRLTLGYWCNSDQTLAVEASGFYMGQRDSHNAVNTGAVVSQPFFNLATGREAVVAAPPATAADLAARMRFYGGEASLRWEMFRCSFGHVDLLGGPRFLQLDESIDLLLVNAAGSRGDSFGTQNQFWGAQLGIDGEVNYGRYFLNSYAKVGVGDTVQTVNISGGNLLTRPSNIGSFTRNHFGFLPEAGANIGITFNEHMRLFGGYSVLWLTGAVRPEDQIDRNVNLTGVGARGPLFQWNENTFWAQGFNGGLEIRY